MSLGRDYIPGPYQDVVPQVQRAVDAIGPGMFIDVTRPAYGAVADGTTDNRTLIQSAFDAADALGGGTVYLPRGDYLVSGSLRVKPNTTIIGDGYSSNLICPAAGWTQVAITNMGILNIDNKSNVRVTGLRFTGTLSVAATAAPFAIYLEGTSGLPLKNVTIDHCTFEDSVTCAIWQGGSGAYTTGITITENYFSNLGYNASAFSDPGYPAVQLNVEQGVISLNRFSKVSVGMYASGARLSIVGNELKDVSAYGIATGDASEIGVTDIVGNVIEFSEGTGNPREGMRIDGGYVSEHLINVVGNIVRFIGTGAGNGICYRVLSARKAQLVGNTAQIQVRGNGFSATGTAAGSDVSLNGNTVRVEAESGSSLAFAARPGGAGSTLNLRSSDNKAYGITRAQGSYAYDYAISGGGTLTGGCNNDWAQQGYVRLSEIIYGDNAAPILDGVPFSDSFTLTAFSDFVRYPRLSTFSIQPPAGALEIASGVIDLAGFNSSTGFARKQTRIIVDTEAAAATDDLDTINGGVDGDVVIVQSANSSRDVVLKHGTGNFKLGSDFTLISTEERAVFQYDGTNWICIARTSAPLTQLGIGGTPAYTLDVNGAIGGAVIRARSNVANDILFYGTGTITGDILVYDLTPNATGKATGTLQNLNNANAGAHAVSEVKTAGASGGDPKFVYTVSGATNWTHGIDNSDSDRWKLCDGDVLGTNTILEARSDGKILVGSLGVGNSASATTPGSVVKKIPVYDASGTLLGYVAVFDAIT